MVRDVERRQVGEMLAEERLLHARAGDQEIGVDPGAGSELQVHRIDRDDVAIPAQLVQPAGAVLHQVALVDDQKAVVDRLGQNRDDKVIARK
ncbi:hypothetical protein [Methylobacterium gregans]|uniref:hypothetical protein n=1 Tax=Methylobacterium gregans TaxID=374424 RepID=UPI0036060056